MFDFGDELTRIESFRVPWLIWIQIFVMLLLLLLLFGFSLSDLDLPGACSNSSASPSLCLEPRFDKNPLFNHRHTTTLVSTCFQASHSQSQVGENQGIKGEIATGTSRRIVVRGGGEDGVEKEGCSSSSSSKEANQNCFHPCHYFRLAKLAFLKCLGLDSTSEQR